MWPVKRPHHLIQFTGNPTVTATHYQQDVLKCAFCDKEYEAPLPAGVKPQRWDETADAAIVIQKIELATPFYRTAQMQQSCGIPLPASVQWERCKVVFEALEPIYKQMQREAANGKIFYGDDTPVRIQELIEENKEKKEGEIYRNEAGTGGMSDAERLHYHQTHSGPVMEELKQWMEKQMAEKKVEPNSGLGKAIDYFQTHLEGLTAWLRYEGAPLDNNPAEQILKPPVMIRKNSYGYKTSKGAEVTAVLLSIIRSCRLNETNVWTYLVSILRRSGEVSKNPKDFLPWIYKGDDTGAAEVRAA